MHVAAGPFTLDTDLSFEPLQALLEVAERERPDVLILVCRITPRVPCLPRCTERSWSQDEGLEGPFTQTVRVGNE